jgi:hypothetical protein
LNIFLYGDDRASIIRTRFTTVVPVLDVIFVTISVIIVGSNIIALNTQSAGIINVLSGIVDRCRINSIPKTCVILLSKQGSDGFEIVISFVFEFGSMDP